MSESDIQQDVMVEGPKHDCILMRNNVGAMQDVTGRTVRYGLGNISKEQNKKIKSSDLIGLTTVVVTPDMVGKTVGIFTAIEVKDKGWTFSDKDKRAVAQLAFINWIKSKGGIAGFVTSVKEFLSVLGKTK
jgi:hypothetical protein